MERACGTLFTAEEFNQYCARELTREMTQEEILRVRARLGELFARWGEVPAGGTLELEFKLPFAPVAK
jgi:hypothetical protein